MRYVSFASGSSGNCGLLRGGGVSLLVDAGISLKRIRACLADEGLELGDLNGILVTHEHSDHVAGLTMLSKYSELPVYMSGGTARAILRQIRCREESLHLVEAGVPFSLGELRVTAFETSHDAAEPLGFRVEGETGVLAIVTDLGYVSRGVREAVEGCAAAVVEANYDAEMLRYGPYPLNLGGAAAVNIRFIAAFSLLRLAKIALKPSTCIAISGVMATIATMPKAKSITADAPLIPTQTPMVIGSTKLEVSGPLATPPESKAIAV